MVASSRERPSLRKALFFLLTGCLLCGGVFCVCFFFFRESEETRIKKVFSALSGEMGKTGNEGLIVAAGKAKAAASACCDSVSFELPDSHMTGTFRKEELQTRIFNVRKLFSSLRLDFLDYEFEILSDTEARVHFSAVLTGRLTNGEEVREIRELSAGLLRQEGEWKFKRIESQKVFSDS